MQQRQIAFEQLMDLKEETKTAIELHREVKGKRNDLIFRFSEAKKRTFARWDSLENELGSDPIDMSSQLPIDEAGDRNVQRDAHDEDELEMRTTSGKQRERDKWLVLKVSK